MVQSAGEKVRNEKMEREWDLGLLRRNNESREQYANNLFEHYFAPTAVKETESYFPGKYFKPPPEEIDAYAEEPSRALAGGSDSLVSYKWKRASEI